MSQNIIGNASTILKTICVMFAGYALGYFISIGLNLPISQEQLGEILFVIIGFIIAYIDARYPNTFKFLDNQPEPASNEEIVLNDEYECA